jgi:hypothetical protein
MRLQLEIATHDMTLFDAVMRCLEQRASWLSPSDQAIYESIVSCSCWLMLLLLVLLLLLIVMRPWSPWSSYVLQPPSYRPQVQHHVSA